MDSKKNPPEEKPIKVEATPVNDGDDGLAAALDALGGGGGDRGGDPGGCDADDKRPDRAAGEMILTLVDAASTAIGRIYAAKLHVRWTNALQRQIKLGDAEKATLRPLAPYAAKYLEKILAKMDAIGAIAFCLVYWGMLSDRLAIVKAEKPIEPKKKGKDEKAPPATPPGKS